MGRQLFQDGPYMDPQVANGTALVATTAENLWLGSQFTPIFANDPKAGKIYTIKAGGIISTSTSGTLIINPMCGTVPTTLGASQTINVPVSQTNVPWRFEFDLVFRSIDPAGSTASVCNGTGVFTMAAGTTAGASCAVPCGGTPMTIFNATVNGFFTVQKTLSVAGSITTQYAYIFSRN